MRKVHE